MFMSQCNFKRFKFNNCTSIQRCKESRHNST